MATTTSSCVHSEEATKNATGASSREEAEARERIVVAAQKRLGQRYRDCSTFVRSVLKDAKVELRNATGKVRSSSEAIHKVIRPVRDPGPGDLAFFHNSYDRDDDGENDDPWSHVAVVESVLGNKIGLIHRARNGIIRIRMDLGHPNDATANDNLRVKLATDPPKTRYLASQLLAGFGSALP